MEARQLAEKGFGATLRRDAWWASPLVVAVGLSLFGVYMTWAALNPYAADGRMLHSWGPYLSPTFSPLLEFSWWPLSPAFLILWAPGGFRLTCYYYRKAYYRAFFLDPAACAVGEPRHAYAGETRFFLFQNLHRFFMYLALVFIVILFHDAWKAMFWPVDGVLANGRMADGPREFGMGLGSLVLLANACLLGAYTFGCHSLRHFIGGHTDCFSCDKFRARYHAWRFVTWFNERHQLFAWISLFWVAFTDFYVRMCALGVWNDPRLF